MVFASIRFRKDLAHDIFNLILPPNSSSSSGSFWIITSKKRKEVFISLKYIFWYSYNTSKISTYEFKRHVLYLLVYLEWSAKDIARGCLGVKFWAMLLVPISEFMLLAYSSANFFIYFFFHRDFRRLIKEKYKRIIASSHNISRTSNRNGEPHLNDAQVAFFPAVSNNEQSIQIDRENTYKSAGNLETIEMNNLALPRNRPSL